MRITDTLTVQHGVFRVVVDFAEQSLADLKSLAEIRRLGRLVMAMLRRHAEVEEEYLFVALNHLLADQGGPLRSHHEHQALEQWLAGLEKATDLAAARKSFRAVLSSLRVHFDHEESVVFPLAERLLSAATLTELNLAWGKQHPKTKPRDPFDRLARGAVSLPPAPPRRARRAAPASQRP